MIERRGAGRALAAVLAFAACAGAPPGAAAAAAPDVPVTAIAVAADGTFACCSQHVVDLHRPPGSVLRAPVAAGRAVAAVALPDGTFAVGGGEPARSGWLRTLARDGAWRGAVAVASDVVGAVARSRDARLVAAGAADGTVSVWPVADAAPPRVVARHDGPCRVVAFLDDGTLVSGGRDGRLLWIDVATGATRAIDERLDHTAGVECLAIGGDGSVASGARDGRVRVHDAQRRLVRTWQRLGGSVLALLPDRDGDAATGGAGAWLAGTDDGRVLRLLPGREDAQLVLAPGAPVHALARAGERLLLGTQQGLVDVPWPPWPRPDVAAR